MVRTKLDQIGVGGCIGAQHSYFHMVIPERTSTTDRRLYRCNGRRNRCYDVAREAASVGEVFVGGVDNDTDGSRG